MNMSKNRIRNTFAVIAMATVVAGGMSTAADASRYCEREARHYANDVTGGGGEDAVRGGILGALTGAVIGGVIDGGRGAGRGALIGGGVGVIGGAAQGGNRWRRAYNRAYRDCERARRANYRRNKQRTYSRARPAAWSPEWYKYCSAKYRSFNPETGYYLAHSGQYRLCK